MSSEADAIAASSEPVTTTTLTSDLRALGIGDGAIVIVHSSLSALGWVAGGAQAVVEALFAAVGPTGTIVMPTQSGQLSDPAKWRNPPVPPQWVPVLRDQLPAFDRYLTPTRGMGQVVECFRGHRSTIRSDHPLLSFAANGPMASAIVSSHPLTPGLGETSPLRRLYDLDADVLLLGVGHANNTSIHLAEYRAIWPGKATALDGAPMLVGGHRQWLEYEDLAIDESDFGRIGEAFARTGVERIGRVGNGVARRCPVRAIVDFATVWMTEHRLGPHGSV